MNLGYLLPPLIAGISNLVLVFLVLQRDRRSFLHRIFSFFLLSMALWGFVIFGMRSSPNLESALEWERFVFVIFTAEAVLFYHFSWIISGRKPRHRIFPIIYLFIILFAIGSFTNLIAVDMQLKFYGYAPVWGVLFIPWIVFCYALTILSLVNIAKFYRTTDYPQKKNQMAYIIAGIACSLVGGIGDILPTMGVHIYPLGIFGNLAFTVLCTIAILKYHLLDIRIAVRKGLAYIVTTGLIGVCYVSLMYFFSISIRDNFGIAGWTNPIITVVVAVAIYPAFRWGQERIDRRFHRERYDHLRALEQFGEETKGVMDLDVLASLLLDTVRSTVKCDKACLLLPDSKGKYFVLVACRGMEGYSRRGLLQKNSALVRWLTRSEGFLSCRDIDIIPQLQAVTARERKMLDEMKAELIIPLRTANGLSGILVLGPKLSEQNYSEEELRMLRVVSRQVATSLDNARLFKELEDSYLELKRAQEQLVQSEKSRALGEMAAGVAHDFNNVLAAILGRAQLALDDTKDGKVRKGLKVIEQAALDGAKTVRRLQDFTRVRVDRRFESLDINQVVNSALQLVEPRLREYRETKGRTVDLTLSLGPVAPVMGSQGELVEVLVNIINNGIDALSGDGKLSIGTRQENGWVIISVSDTGVGIPDDIKSKIFDPYFSTKGYGGTGLGLSVAYGIVTRHGGDIVVDSIVGEGTTFCIKLPVAVEKKVSSRPSTGVKADTPAVSRVVHKADILVVEDDKKIRDTLVSMLAYVGHKVTTAAGGEKGIAMFREGNYELVITDLGMPEVSGWKVAEAVKREGAGTPVILITGWGVQFEIEEARRVGVDEIITKPFTKEELYKCVTELLGKVSRAVA